MVFVVAALLLTSGDAQATLTIEPGREKEIVALFRPHALGAEVTPGWRLMQVQIQRTFIDAVVETPAGAEGPTGRLRLEHARQGPTDAETTASFALVPMVEDLSPEGPGEAVARLMEAVRANDAGTFWRAAPAGAKSALQRGLPWYRVLPAQLLAWALDGIVLLAATLVLLVLLIRRQLREAPRWVGPALAGVVLAGAAVRWLLSEQIALGVWPYSRILRIAAAVNSGPLLGWFSEATGGSLYFTEVTFATNYLIAVLTPLAIFAHGHFLLGPDPRRAAWGALAAAALLAVFPNHIRFSRSEVEFIPSLALTSLCFALLHVALADRARAWRLAALVLLPLYVAGSIVTRELNILMPPLLILAAVWLRGAETPRGRLGAVLVAVTAAGLAGYFFHIVPYYSQNVQEGLRLETLRLALATFFDPEFNTLVNPRVTPPLVTGLALAGFVVLWRESERRHALFLLAWLGFYFAAHSYANGATVEMQARYHLHLAPPLLFLAAPALRAAFSWRVAAGWAAAAVLAASPFLHAEFIRDVDLNDMHEFRFLERVRAGIPDGCTVLEYPGTVDFDQRLPRMGTVLVEGRKDVRWRLSPIGTFQADAPPGTDPLRPEVRELLAQPPPCLFFYEGLACFSDKPAQAPLAAACAAVREAVVLEPEERVRFRSRMYDPNLARGLGELASGELELTLYRAYRKPPAEAGVPPP